LRITSPIAVATNISPLGVPSAFGNNIIKDSPISLTVMVKSVPRIETLALGVEIAMFSLFILFNLPVINLAVPLANCRAILDLDGSGS